MLTVVQTLPALEVGGVERGTLEVAAALARAGHRSVVVSAGGRLAGELVREGSEHLPLDIGRKSLLTLRHIPALRRLLVETRADILHSRSRLPAWISYLAWRGLPPQHRPRFVTTVHGPYSVNRYSRIMTRGERVIAVSRYIHDYILDNYPDTDPERVVTIPRGVSPEQYPYGYQPGPAWMEEWSLHHPISAGTSIVTLPGRITSWKGAEDFLEILARLRDKGIRVHGLVAGGADHKSTPFADRLQAKSRTLGLERDLSFLGHRDDLREIISISSMVLVLSKIPEAFGRVALESLSLGIPVVAYRRGGASEILEALFPDGLVEPDAIDQAVSRIGQFIRQPPTVPAGNNPYTLTSMLEQTLGLYQELAAAPRD